MLGSSEKTGTASDGCREKNRAAVLYGKEDLRVEYRAVPEINDTEVLVKVAYTGICGTDVHLYKHAQLGDMVMEGPMVLGHEASGTVAQVGEKVTDLKPGDRVAMDNVFPCLRCKFCKRGRHNLCSNARFGGNPPTDGSLQTYAAYPAVSCTKLPDSISLEEGALVEPLSIGVYACQRGSVKLGQRVLVCGAGTIGLVSAMSALACGASKVCLTDISAERLETAKKIVPQCKTFCVSQSKDPVSGVTEVMGDRPDVTIECSGAKKSVHLALQVTETGGKVVLVGFGDLDNLDIPLQNNVLRREVDIVGVFGRDASIYPQAIDAIQSGSINLSGLITHRRNLEQIADAIDIAATGRDNAIKVMVNISK